MSESRDDGSVAPRRGLGGPILPPPPPGIAEDTRQKEADKAAAAHAQSEKQAARAASQAQKLDAKQSALRRPARVPPRPKPASVATSGQGAPRRTRRARLRLVQVDAWSVMKTSFMLSIALGIVLVVAVAIIWSVLGAAGVWESINSIVQQALGDNSEPFDIQEYVGTSRVLGFAMIVAVLDVVLITAMATLGAFLYNLSAALLGGIEVTLAEDS
jgi:Transmembrane domain of unknown function (DUF3566)